MLETQLIRWWNFIIKYTTCFGPCTGPSSGLKLCVGGDCTVWYTNKLIPFQRHLVDMVTLIIVKLC